MKTTRISCLLLASTVGFVFSGCTPALKKPDAEIPQPVTGQVFVVTKSAQNIKLGSVTVSATPEQDVLSRMSIKDIYMEAMKPILEKAVQDAEKAYQAAEKTHHQLQVYWEDIFTRNLGNDYGPAGDASEPYRKLLASEKERNEKKSDLARARLRLASFPTAEFLYERFPEGPHKTVTDADGNFIITVPKPGKYAIAARASRQVGSEKEDYFWLVWLTVGPEAQRLLLTNSNLITSKSPDSVLESAKASDGSSN